MITRIKTYLFRGLRAVLSERHLFHVLNVYYLLSGRGRLRIEAAEGGMYRLTDGSNDEAYLSQFSHFQLYRRGVAWRVAHLADQYHLSTIKVNTDGVLIDCGAFIGELGIWARQQSLHYLAFNPEPLEQLCAEANTGAPIDPRALWNSTSRLTFFSKSRTADSSLIDPGDAEYTFEIDAVRLDEAVDGDCLMSVPGTVILKVEAEGAEPEVLQGATGILPQVDYVTVDCSPERGVLQESTLLPVCSFLANHGFSIEQVDESGKRALFRNAAKEK